MRVLLAGMMLSAVLTGAAAAKDERFCGMGGGSDGRIFGFLHWAGTEAAYVNAWRRLSIAADAVTLADGETTFFERGGQIIVSHVVPAGAVAPLADDVRLTKVQLTFFTQAESATAPVFTLIVDGASHGPYRGGPAAGSGVLLRTEASFEEGEAPNPNSNLPDIVLPQAELDALVAALENASSVELAMSRGAVEHARARVETSGLAPSMRAIERWSDAAWAMGGAGCPETPEIEAAAP